MKQRTNSLINLLVIKLKLQVCVLWEKLDNNVNGPKEIQKGGKFSNGRNDGILFKPMKNKSSPTNISKGRYKPAFFVE